MGETYLYLEAEGEESPSEKEEFEDSREGFSAEAGLGGEGSRAEHKGLALHRKRDTTHFQIGSMDGCRHRRVHGWAVCVALHFFKK